MVEPRRPLKVFLCHASQDKPAVRELSRRLIGDGWIDTWLDENKLLPGQDWRLSIEEAVETSDVVIICLSENSVSKEGYVQKELRYAREIALEKPDETIFLIPLRLDDCGVPRGLRFYQWVDYFGEKKNEAYNALVESLKLRHKQKLRLEETECEASVRSTQKVADRESVESSTQEPAKRKSAAKIAKPLASGQRLRSTVIGSYIIVSVCLLITIGACLWMAPRLNLPAWMWDAPKPTATVTTITLTPTKQQTPAWTFTPVLAKIETPTKTRTPIPTSLPIEIKDTKDVRMVLVPAGEFNMGSNNGDSSERPVHQVYLDAFYIDKYEVTNAHYQACVAAGGCQYDEWSMGHSLTRSNYYANPKYNDYPVVNVYWEEAKTYCEWRGARLPTEAEWEKAARGTDGRTYPWGEGISCSYANYSDCKGDTTEVGSYLKGESPYGVYDMAGNVWEWVNDVYDENYYQNSSHTNPLGPTSSSSLHVLRGGAWFSSDVRSANRDIHLASGWPNYYGFRCARDVNP